jgi:cation:H+ antiporter
MAAAHALSATASLLLTAIVMLFLVLDVNWTLWRMGPGTVAVVVAYLFTLRLVYFDQQYALRLQPPAEETAARPWWPYAAGFLAAAGVVLLAGPRLAHTADELAALTGLGRTFFGTVFVASVTSLPEIVTTLEAVRMGARDLAIGNIFGSNAFNMVIPALGDLASGQPILTMAADTHLITAAAVILVTAVATMGLLYRAEKRYWLVEPDSALVMLLIFGALGLVYYYRP